MILKYAFVGLILLTGVNASAQGQENANEKVATLTTEMTTALSLSSEQVEQVSNLNLKVAEKIQAIKDNAQLDSAKKKEFIEGNKKDHKNVMSSILTADQFVIYEKWLSEQKENYTDDEDTH